MMCIRKKMKENHFHTALLSSDFCYNYSDIALRYYNQKKDSCFQ